MIAVLGTLPFLATLWLLVMLGAKVLEESGGKILAALGGGTEQPAIVQGGGRLRHQRRARTSRTDRVSLRAAA
ncbi:MAG TPA: hypothetical protein VNR86_06295 [Sphingomicrobium sp.]|nr:hypothetical protein [Sphingomicrobium sp.]